MEREYKTPIEQRERVKRRYKNLKRDPLFLKNEKFIRRVKYALNKNSKPDLRCRGNFKKNEYDRDVYAIASINGRLRVVFKPSQCRKCRLMFTPENVNQTICLECGE